MCEVTIVIPNYKGKEYLFSCVKSLYEKDQTEKKILIIDNASNDGSIEEVVKEYPEVECVMLDKNYGFCRAVNIGIEKTDTAYVILLNNDTVIKDNYVKYLLDSIKKDPNIFSVEPKMIQYHDPSKIDSAGTYYNALGWAYAYGKDKSVKKYNNIRKIFAACGGASIYRKKVFEEIGMFDEKHFAYLEDIDVGFRAKIYGYKNVYCPSAMVYHVGSGTSGSRYNSFKVRLAARNNIYLNYKNMPWPQLLLNALPLGLGILVKYGFFKKIGFGKDYLDGLKEGVKTAKLCKKVKYNRDHLKHYAAIEWELCTGTLLYIREFLARQAAKR